MPIFNLQPLSLARKAVLLFTLPAVAQLVFVVALALVERQSRHELEQENRLRAQRATAGRLLGEIFDLQLSTREYLVTAADSALARFDASDRAVDPLVASLAEVGTPESRRIVAEAARTIQLQRKTRRAIAAGKLEMARTSFLEEVTGAMGRFRSAHEDFVAALDVRAMELESAHLASTRRLRRIITAGTLAGLLLLLLLGAMFVRTLVRRLGIVVENTRRLERGQMMAARMRPGDEVAELDAALHRMAASLTEQGRELRAAHAEMESFAYSVSHDLRAPLRAITGYAEMLEEDCSARLDGEGLRYLGTIRAEARRMGLLIDDLLRLSRVSRHSLVFSEVDVESIVRSCIDELRRSLGERRVDFRIESLPHATGDASLLRVVLMNLLSNAVKYTGRRELAVVHVSGGVLGTEAFYRITDNGVGFDMRYAHKLFSPFQRLHDASEFEGTGVGLALVQRVVERHGGRVSVESAMGEGTTFTLVLPGVGEVHDAA